MHLNFGKLTKIWFGLALTFPKCSNFTHLFMFTLVSTYVTHSKAITVMTTIMMMMMMLMNWWIDDDGIVILIIIILYKYFIDF